MLGLGFASALVILVDELVLGYRQQMPIMNLVHPITALYWGPLWLRVYFGRGRKSSHRWAHREAARLLGECAEPAAKAEELRRRASSTERADLRPWHVGNAVSHRGAGCTLGDVAGEWTALMLGITWFGTWSGHQLPEELLIDFLFAAPDRDQGRLRFDRRLPADGDLHARPLAPPRDPRRQRRLLGQAVR
ncbi:MAG TPA: hypothetical protein VFL60_01090 [Gaiellaceae bacterium]|nr:hypothetical protein [Gaiellaceae bacterium]